MGVGVEVLSEKEKKVILVTLPVNFFTFYEKNDRLVVYLIQV